MTLVPTAEDFREVKYTIDDDYENFILVQPPTIPDDMPFDPYGQLAHILRRDWSKFSPTGRVPVLVVDTLSEASEDVHRFVGTSGRGNSGAGEIYGMEIEDPWDGNSIRLGQQYDYSKSQDMTIALIKMAMSSRQFQHVILLGHRKEMYEEKMVRERGQYVTRKELVGYDLSIPGRRWLGNMTKFTEQYLWHSNDGIDSMDIRLHLRSDGRHHTKFRTTQVVPGEIAVPFDYEGMAQVIRDVAGYAGYDLNDPFGAGFRTVCYGVGNTGKTMLWTSFPEEILKHGPVLYVPYDPGAARLTSVWPELCSKKTRV